MRRLKVAYGLVDLKGLPDRFINILAKSFIEVAKSRRFVVEKNGLDPFIGAIAYEWLNDFVHRFGEPTRWKSKGVPAYQIGDHVDFEGVQQVDFGEEFQQTEVVLFPTDEKYLLFRARDGEEPPVIELHLGNMVDSFWGYVDTPAELKRKLSEDIYHEFRHAADYSLLMQHGGEGEKEFAEGSEALSDVNKPDLYYNELTEMKSYAGAFAQSVLKSWKLRKTTQSKNVLFDEKLKNFKPYQMLRPENRKRFIQMAWNELWRLEGKA